MKTQVEIPSHVLDWLEGRDRQAYQKGWEDATAALVQAAASARPGGKIAEKPTTPAFKPPVSPPPANETNRDRIIRALKAKPGMRAADIARWLINENPEVNRMTILTMTKRMQKDHALRKRGNGLYVNEIRDQEAK